MSKITVLKYSLSSRPCLARCSKKSVQNMKLKFFDFKTQQHKSQEFRAIMEQNHKLIAELTSETNNARMGGIYE